MASINTIEAFPHVVVDPCLLDTTSPYRVDFDQGKAAKLFLQNGMEPVYARQLNIVLAGKGKTSFEHGGTYFGSISPHPEKTIVLATGNIWKDLERKLRKDNSDPEEVLRESNRGLNRNFLSLAHLAIEDSRYALWRIPLHEEAVAFGIPVLLATGAYTALAGPHVAEIPAPNELAKALVYLVGFIGSIYVGVQAAGRVYTRLNFIPGAINRENRRFVQQMESHPDFKSIVRLNPTQNT